MHQEDIDLIIICSDTDYAVDSESCNDAHRRSSRQFVYQLTLWLEHLIITICMHATCTTKSSTGSNLYLCVNFYDLLNGIDKAQMHRCINTLLVKHNQLHWVQFMHYTHLNNVSEYRTTLYIIINTLDASSINKQVNICTRFTLRRKKWLFYLIGKLLPSCGWSHRP